MGIGINSSALAFVQQHGKLTPALNKSIEKISTGLRIPNASADPAGLAVSKMMEAENVSFQQALRNTNDGISMVQTAEGTVDQAGQLLSRMRELSVQSSNGTYNDEDRGIMNEEFTQLKDEFDRISSNANFNGIDLFNDPSASPVNFQVGGDSNPGSQVGLDIGSLAMSSTDLGFNSAGISSQGGAESAIGSIDSAIEALQERRSTLGATQNRLDVAFSEATTYSENLSASSSQITDLDYALEASTNSQFLLRQKALLAAQSQAKSMSQSAVSLLSK